VVRALEEFGLEQFFQRDDLFTDRTLREIQFPGRAGEAPSASRHVESEQHARARQESPGAESVFHWNLHFPQNGQAITMFHPQV